MRRILAVLGLFTLFASPVRADDPSCNPTSSSVLVAFAFEEITVSTTVKILTRATWKPTDGTGAVMAFITFADAAARFNVDGSVPSTTSGHIAADASSLKICTDSIGKFQVIRDDGTDVEMSVSYYRYPQ